MLSFIGGFIPRGLAAMPRNIAAGISARIRRFSTQHDNITWEMKDSNYSIWSNDIRVLISMYKVAKRVGVQDVALVAEASPSDRLATVTLRFSAKNIALPEVLVNLHKLRQEHLAKKTFNKP
jgi:hypothetical protein